MTRIVVEFDVKGFEAPHRRSTDTACPVNADMRALQVVRAHYTVGNIPPSLGCPLMHRKVVPRQGKDLPDGMLGNTDNYCRK